MYVKSLHSVKMYCILLVVCFIIYSPTTSTGTTLNSGTCVNPTTLSFIENSLANLNMSDSINTVTNLFQLSLLKEMVGSCKEKSYKDTNSNNEGLSLLKRIELILNTSAADIRALNISTADLRKKMDAFVADLNNSINSSIAGIGNKIYTSTATTNARLSAIEPQLVSLQSQVSSLSSDVKKISQLLSRHVNITVDDEEEAPSSPLLSSCEAILSKWPNSPSGYYSLVDVNGHTRHVYCHMETLCGKGGGWRRIASLNMTDPNEKCPTQFRTYSQDGVRACGRPATSSGSCVGITFSSRDIRYSQVCGRMIGYQVGYTDAAHRHQSGGNINTPYTDGISLTYGNPRKHIWTLMSGGTDRGLYNRCPCGSTQARSALSFVGSDYYCESGYQGVEPTLGVFYTSDPLWDGKDCGSSETACCQCTLIPWFYQSIAHSTTNYIEMRICCDEGTNDEDVPIEQYDIYVK